MISESSRYEYINVEELTPFDRNPKKHPPEQIEKIKKSIQEFGWTRPILAIKHDGENVIVVGHGAHKAAIELNLRQVPVVFLDLPYEKAIAYNIADNKLAELAEWDEGILQGLLTELQEYAIDFDVIGFNESELEDLLSDNFYDEKELDESLTDGEELLIKFKVIVPLKLTDEVEEKLNELKQEYGDIKLEKIE